jgi:hypothetical protein
LGVNTTGSYNTALGVEALVSNTTASNNTAVGYQAGYTNATGTRSVLVGGGAGYAATALDGDTHIGFSAGNAQTTGFANTFVGSRGSASANSGAGNNVTTGTYNTFIGGSAGGSVTTGSKNTILGNYTGNNGGLDIRTADNYIVLSDGDGNPRGFFSSSTWIVGSSAGANWDTSASGGGSSITLGNYYSRNPNATSGRYWSTGPDSTNSYLVYNQASTGVYIANGGTAWNSSSDERFKDIIEPITDAVNKVSTLRAVIGKYKTDEEGTRRSFLIAQDVQSVLPEAVDATNPEKLGVAYTDVIPLLVAAIKEQTALINSLKARLDAANL